MIYYLYLKNNYLIFTRTPIRLKVAPINNKKNTATVWCVEFNISTNLKNKKITTLAKQFYKNVMYCNIYNSWKIARKNLAYVSASWYFLKHVTYCWYITCSFDNSCSLFKSYSYLLICCADVILSICSLRNTYNSYEVFLKTIQTNQSCYLYTYPIIENKLHAWVVHVKCIVSAPTIMLIPTTIIAVV